MNLDTKYYLSVHVLQDMKPITAWTSTQASCELFLARYPLTFLGDRVSKTHC